MLRIDSSDSASPTDLLSSLSVPASHSFCSFMTSNFSARLPLIRKNVFFSVKARRELLPGKTGTSVYKCSKILTTVDLAEIRSHSLHLEEE